MKKRYPHQVLSRLASADEKAMVEKLAKDNGISVSNAIRLLILEAHRKGWTLRLQPAARRAIRKAA